jgi:membrane-associated phospholipid phosphatase
MVQSSTGKLADMAATFIDQLNFVDRLYWVWFIGLGLLILIFHGRVSGWPWYLFVHAATLAAIALLAQGARRSRALRFLHDWYPLLVFIVAFEEVARLSFLIVSGWRDYYILAAEQRIFGIPPTVWINRHANPVVTEILEVGYFSYFLLLMIVGGVLYHREPTLAPKTGCEGGAADKRPFRQVMTASVLAYMVCYVFFILFPTEGPAYTLRQAHTIPLHGGPFHWMVLLIQKYAGVHGNAFPSSHVAAGVVAVIFAWKYAPWVGAWLTPLVILLCLGAVNDRYHYLSDVVAGIGVGVLTSLLVLAGARWQSSTASRERTLTAVRDHAEA